MIASDSLLHWHIGVAAWIIQDGNYDDFYQGQVATFALESSWNTVHLSDEEAKAVQHIGGANYHIRGEVLYTARDAWVVDYGIRSYHQGSVPEGVEVGRFVRGEMTLGIDPYFYSECLREQRGMPALTYTWRIDRLSRQTAPYITAPSGVNAAIRQRNVSKLAYEGIERTRAWEDDGGLAEYILHCTLLDQTPTA